jgi:ectoine hydroxylase-related dioxygenase (phytanoyl-CoA dioxygenase family)
MNFTQLTTEQRRSFDEDGFLLVPNALSAETVRQLIEAGDRLAEAFLKKPQLIDRPQYNHLDFRPGVLKEEAMVALVTNASTVPLVVQLLGPNIHLHSTALIYKKPERPDTPAFRRGWHRDIRMPKDMGHASLPRVGIKICYCLTDFHQPESGMTLMARGTHLRTTPLVVPKDRVDPPDVEVCDFRLKSGDAFLFENRIFHTAAPNRSNRTSKVLMYGYAYRWMTPEVYLENPDKGLLEKSGSIARQLLGAYRDIDTVPWALREWMRRHKVEPAPVPWTVEN